MGDYYSQFTPELLRSNPELFIQQCQPIIHACIHQYTASGLFPRSEKEDIAQSVNEYLLSSLHSIEQNYDGRVLFRTYVGVVIRNACLRVFQRQYANKIVQHIREDQAHQYEYDPTDALLLEEELERLHTVLQLFRSDQQTIYICMKLFFKIPLLQQDLRQWSRRVKSSHRKMLMRTFGRPYGQIAKEDVFDLFAIVWNSFRRYKSTGDGIHRWTARRIRDIIKLMNGNPPRRSHSFESLQTLLSEEYNRLTEHKF
jgi:RNA polymerase sigma factor (sigma-70 family)